MRLIITIELQSEMDPSQVLDWAQISASDLADNCEGSADENKVSVETKGEES